MGGVRRPSNTVYAPSQAVQPANHPGCVHRAADLNHQTVTGRGALQGVKGAAGRRAGELLLHPLLGRAVGHVVIRGVAGGGGGQQVARVCPQQIDSRPRKIISNMTMTMANSATELPASHARPSSADVAAVSCPFDR